MTLSGMTYIDQSHTLACFNTAEQYKFHRNLNCQIIGPMLIAGNVS